MFHRHFHLLMYLRLHLQVMYLIVIPTSTIETLGVCMFSYIRQDRTLVKGGAIWCLNSDQEGQMLANRRC